MERRVSTSTVSILMLDEDRLALELYSRELESSYRVITCESVEETRQHLRGGGIDALVIEPAVNDGEGWALLAEIRAFPNPPQIILCSVEDERKIGIEQGALAYVVKPVLPTALHALLDQIVAKHPSSSAVKLEKGT